MVGKWCYSTDEEGETPMSRALKSGYGALTDFMLRQEEEEAEAETAEKESRLQRAAYWGLGDAVQRLLDAGADPDEVDPTGETALHKAVREGHRDVVEVLLSKGADVNARNELGLSPLHWAALTGRTDLIELLLEHGAQPDIADTHMGGFTPLAVAKIMGYHDAADVLASHTGL